MGKIIGWIKDNRLVATIIAVLSVVAGAILVVLILGWWGIIDLDKTTSAGELLRTFILCIGAIGGVYGLHLATERQKTFSDQVQGQSKQVELLSDQVQEQSKQVQVLSEQVKVQADQSFNERLGRGVELLAKDDVVMRSAGVRVLVDLFDSASETQKSIVANIIYDFFYDKASTRRDENNKRLPPAEKRRQDLQNALNFLIGLSLDERKKLLPNQIVHGKLKLTHLDFNLLDFPSKVIKDIDFSASYLCGVNFEKKVIIENVDFFLTRVEDSRLDVAEIRNSDFMNAKITSFYFYSCDIENSDFMNATIKKSWFNDVQIMDTKFKSTQFIHGKFSCKNKITVASLDDLPEFICTDLSGANFDFDDGIDQNECFESCYYRKGERPSEMNENREYISTLGMNVFVESDEPWSGQPVEARIELEVAEWKFEQTRETSHNIKEQKTNIASLANGLKAAEAQLQRRRDKFNNP